MDLLHRAVLNNRDWCNLVSPTSGAAQDSEVVWLDRSTPAPYFPDAITLRPGVAAARISNLLSTRSACSVKDSFDDVDLTPHGFTKLFDAEWIGVRRVKSGELPTNWVAVTDQQSLGVWCSAAGLPRSLPAHLLTDVSVRVLCAPGHATPRAGAILYESSGVVGLSNVFVGPDETRSAWGEVAAAAATYFPGRPLVGYETGADLVEATANGFAKLRPVCIWTRH